MEGYFEGKPLISLDTQPQSPLINLDKGPAEPGAYLLDPVAIRNRAQRYAYATQQGVTTPDMINQLSSGAEGPLRDSEAAVTNSKMSDKRYELMRQTVASGKNLTPDAMRLIDQAASYNFPYKYPRRPEEIFEANLGEKYMSDLNRFAATLGTNNFWNYGQQMPTTQKEAIDAFGSTSAATDALLNTFQEDGAARMRSQSWFGAGMDIAGSLVSGNVEYKLRGNVPGVGFTEGGTLAGNLEAQRQMLLNMPWDQRAPLMRQIYNTLADKNPHIAMAWVTAMKGQSIDERAMNALNTINVAGDAALVYSVAKIPFNVGLQNVRVARAVAQATKEAAVSGAGKDTIAASYGDTVRSGNIAGENLLTGRERGTGSIWTGGPPSENLLTGRIDPNVDFVQQAKNTLYENMNIFNNQVTAEGSWNQAAKINYINENTTRVNMFMDLISSALRPTRVSLANLNDEQLDRVGTIMRQRYGGDNNNIFRYSAPFQEPITRTWWQTLRQGAENGSLFRNPFEAIERMRQKGIRVSLTEEQLKDVDLRLADVRKELKELPTPDMGADVEGLNLYYHQSDALKMQIEHLEELKKNSRPGGATIKQQGLGYYVEFNAPLKEADLWDVKRMVVNTKDPLEATPKGWFQKVPYFDWFRTSEDTMSVAHSAQRKAAISPQALFHEALQQINKDYISFLKGYTRYDPVTGDLNPWYKRGLPGIGKLQNRESIARMKETLLYSQRAKDPVTQVDGWWMNPDEFKNHWLNTYKVSPTLAEQMAYESARRTDEVDRIFRQIMTVRNRAARGALNHTIWMTDAAGNKIYSEDFNGTVLPRISGKRGTILIMGKDATSSKVVSLADDLAPETKLTLQGKQSVATKTKYDELIDSGKYKYIQLDNTEEARPFKQMGIPDSDKLIQHVLVPSERVETESLKWDTVQRTGGGRFGYEYQKYLKFPNMLYEKVGGKMHAYYLGDHAVLGLPYEGAGIDIRDKANKVLDLLEAKRGLEARKLFINSGLEGALEPWDEFIKKFRPFEDELGNLRNPVYSTMNRFEVVDTNRSIKQMSSALEDRHGPKAKGEYKDSWRDGLEVSPEKAFQVAFTQKRDADGFQAVIDKGTRNNPIYDRQPAEKVDPLMMMNRAMRSAVTNFFMDDYKAYAVNSWLSDNYKLLNEGTDVFNSPFASFRAITKGSFRPGADAGDVSRALGNYYKINQFTHQPTILDTFVHSITQDLTDFAYEKFGPRAAIVPAWLLPRVKDPFTILRSMTMNATLGLFSPAQLLVQSMNYATMIAISPTHGLAGTYGAFLHHLALMAPHNTEYLQLLDKMASSLRMPGLPVYKPGEWLEAYNELKLNGGSKVGGSQSLMNNQHRVNIIQNGFDKFLEWGRFPWQLGEANSKVGSHFIAMKEFRTKDAVRAISNLDRAEILNNADRLYGNMTSASHSMINEGVFSLPSQFYMYAYRLGELFWSGSRLGGTLAERNLARARIIGVHAALFGLPMSLGVTGFPAAQWLRDKLLEDGFFGLTPQYVPGDKFVTSMLNEGVISAMTAMATGKWLNMGTRLGTSGLNPVEDLLQGDKSYLRILGGASVNFTLNTIQNGFVPFASLVMKGNFGDIRMMHVYDMFKEVKTLGDAGIFWNNLYTGKWVDKNWNYLTDADKKLATFMIMTGAKPISEQSDLFAKRQIIQGREENQKWSTKQFDRFWNAAIMAEYGGDSNMAQKYKQTALAYIDQAQLTPDQVASVLKSAEKLYLKYSDRIDKSFFMLTAPPKRYDQSMDAYRRTLNVREGK